MFQPLKLSKTNNFNIYTKGSYSWALYWHIWPFVFVMKKLSNKELLQSRITASMTIPAIKKCHILISKSNLVKRKKIIADKINVNFKIGIFPV